MKRLTTEQKLDFIISLLQEVETEINEKAESIKDIDLPLYRMLTEDGSHSIKKMCKDSLSQLDTFKARLKRADELLRG